MELTAPKTLRLKRVLASRLLRVGTLAALLSASANAIVLAIASSFLGAVVIPRDETVTSGRSRRCDRLYWRGCHIRRHRPLHAAPGAHLLGRLGCWSAPFVRPDSLGGHHVIVCGSVGPHAGGGPGHQRRSAHEVGPEGVRRVGATRDLERRSVTLSLR
jgi:hypothetical protein